MRAATAAMVAGVAEGWVRPVAVTGVWTECCTGGGAGSAAGWGRTGGAIAERATGAGWTAATAGARAGTRDERAADGCDAGGCDTGRETLGSARLASTGNSSRIHAPTSVSSGERDVLRTKLARARSSSYAEAYRV